MGYRIEYKGYVDKSNFSIISGIGTSNLQSGDSFRLEKIEGNTNPSNWPLLSVAQESRDTEGFIYWDDVTATSVGNSYTINNSYSSNSFFRLNFKGLTVGTSFGLAIITENEKVAKAFLSSQAKILPSGISRKLFTSGKQRSGSIQDVKTELVSTHFVDNGGVTTSRYFTSFCGSDPDYPVGTNLIWNKTGDPSIFSTHCYIKNLHNKTLDLGYSVHGTVWFDAEKSRAVWRAPLPVKNENEISSEFIHHYDYLRVLIEPGEIRCLEYNVISHSKDSLVCWLYDPTKTNSCAKLGFDKLFWRFNIEFEGVDSNAITDRPHNFIFLSKKIKGYNDYYQDITDLGKSFQIPAPATNASTLSDVTIIERDIII